MGWSAGKKQPEEGATQKQGGKKQSWRHARISLDERGKEKMAKWSELSYEQGEMSSRAGVRSLAPAGRQQSLMRVQGCAGHRFLWSAARVYRTSRVISAPAPSRTGSTPVHPTSVIGTD